MPKTGGRAPFDKTNALGGTVARVLWALPTVALPADLSAIVDQVADVNGEYPTKTGWNDFGLAADAPSYSRSADTESMDYEHKSGLFETVSDVARQFTAHIAEIEPENMKIVENSTITEAVAASAAAAPVKKAAQTKLWVGNFTGFAQYRIAMIQHRPAGAGVVTEPGGLTRPPAVARILPLVVLSGDETSMDFGSGDPVDAEVQFTVLPDPTLGVGKEHGYWVFEQPGAILA